MRMVMFISRPIMHKLRDVKPILGLSRWTLYRWIREGKLEALRLPSGHFRVPDREMERLRDKMAQSCSPDDLCEETAGDGRESERRKSRRT